MIYNFCMQAIILTLIMCYVIFAVINFINSIHKHHNVYDSQNNNFLKNLWIFLIILVLSFICRIAYVLFAAIAYRKYHDFEH